jgi:hypothetical protein
MSPCLSGVNVWTIKTKKVQEHLLRERTNYFDLKIQLWKRRGNFLIDQFLDQIFPN